MNGGYYVVIPAKVLQDNDLLKYPKTILLYGHISNLANKKGYCWATNKYFMDQLGVKSATTITDYLNLLARKGYIQKKKIYKDGTKQIEKRIISIDTGTPIPADCNTPITAERHTPIPADCNTPITAERHTPIPADCNTPITAERHTPIPADCKENNTSINNTSNNNSSTTEQPKKTQNAFENYQIHVGMLSGMQTPIFSEYVQKLSDEVVSYAIDNMLNQTARPNFNYLRKILDKYERLRVNSVEKAEELEEKHSKKQEEIHQARNNRYVGRKPRQEKMPYWYHEKDNSEKKGETKSEKTETKSEIARLMQKINGDDEKNE